MTDVWVAGDVPCAMYFESHPRGKDMKGKDLKAVVTTVVTSKRVPLPLLLRNHALFWTLTIQSYCTV